MLLETFQGSKKVRFVHGPDPRLPPTSNFFQTYEPESRLDFSSQYCKGRKEVDSTSELELS